MYYHILFVLFLFLSIHSSTAQADKIYYRTSSLFDMNKLTDAGDTEVLILLYDPKNKQHLKYINQMLNSKDLVELSEYTVSIIKVDINSENAKQFAAKYKNAKISVLNNKAPIAYFFYETGNIYDIIQSDFTPDGLMTTLYLPKLNQTLTNELAEEIKNGNADAKTITETINDILKIGGMGSAEKAEELYPYLLAKLTNEESSAPENFKLMQIYQQNYLSEQFQSFIKNRADFEKKNGKENVNLYIQKTLSTLLDKVEEEKLLDDEKLLSELSQIISKQTPDLYKFAEMTLNYAKAKNAGSDSDKFYEFEKDYYLNYCIKPLELNNYAETLSNKEDVTITEVKQALTINTKAITLSTYQQPYYYCTKAQVLAKLGKTKEAKEALKMMNSLSAEEEEEGEPCTIDNIKPIRN